MALSDLHQSKRGVAAMIACLVQTLNETEPTFQARFLARLEAAYTELRDNPPPASTNNDEMAFETLSWVMELLTGWDTLKGQGKPFLSDYEPKASSRDNDA